VLRALAQAGRPFVGFLFTQVMVGDDGLRVVEFNARFGDPEAQAIFPRLDADLLELVDKATDGRLADVPVTLPVREDASCCVVMASGGYPGDYQTGLPIEGLDDLPSGAVAFHAGTRREGDRWLTAGGRVLGITASGHSVPEAAANAYKAVASVSFQKAHYRRDIGR
jgi:phosphoribosylamine--glycine ligase